LADRAQAPLLSSAGAEALSERVPYFDLAGQYDEIRDELLAAIERVCTNSQFVLGDEVARFEHEFADYCGVRHCVALNTGTSALHLALLAGGVQPGDEVITSPNTFIATAESISYTGARPVFADIRPETGNIDPQALEQVITERTRAIVPVHLYGRPADLQAILDIAERHSLAVIEDACQAHGARYQGTRVGAFGLAGVFSFYPSKNLGAYGEGGALTTNDDNVAELARMLRDHGSKTRYHHDAVGFNYRMDGFQGAVLRIKLRRLDEWTAKRQELAALYRNLLAGANVDLPRDDPDDECVYYVFVVYVDDRDSVQAALEARGIGTGVHFPIPLHLQKAYTSLGYNRGDFPHSENACDRTLSLPLFPEMSQDQVRQVAAVLADVVGAT
jgi:dTDP-4-amino-4,6-dideoxygalactose transaminase